MAIRVLPTHLVNKIAAGEVIERPASIVKELVENALDAGSSRIEVTVEDGGRRLIAVGDDGGGMDPADLPLAFVPHATSKITSDEDLFAIATMGFRGEALASIASVSHATIRSRPPAAEVGHEIAASGEQVGEVRPCAGPAGTTVTVRDLFFNTPARRKFLKTAATEFGHISEQFARLALPHPRVALRLTHNGRAVQDLPAAATTAERVRDLFGAEAADGLMPIRPRPGAAAEVAGLIGRPEAARPTGTWQYFYLNGRYIRDRLLAHALREAYRGLIDPQRWPVAFVFLTMDPAEVDVNVHPTKIEVRFRDSQAVHSAVLGALRETLNHASLSAAARFDAPLATVAAEGDSRGGGTDKGGAPAGGTGEDGSSAGGVEGAAAPATHDDARRQSLRQALADFFRTAPSPQPRLGFPAADAAAPRAVGNNSDLFLRAGDTLAAAAEPGVTLEDVAGVSPAAPPAAPADSAAGVYRPEQLTVGETNGPTTAGATDAAPSGDAATFGLTAPQHALPEAIQIANAYIVAACEDGLVIIDQHALHERLLYNDLKRRLAAEPLLGQRRLLPETLKLTDRQVDALRRRADLLSRLGIEVEPFGPGTLAVQRFPAMLSRRGVAPAEFLHEVADLLTENEHAEAEAVLESLLEMMACKAAVKAGDRLGPAEIADLLARRVEAEKASACPHGRPTTLRLTLKELAKQFKRI